jgi:diguanylate cyclase (GGDEF)-like protein
MSILIIDHSIPDQEQLKFLLNLGGFFELTFTASIAEAFQVLKVDDLESEPPHVDLILIDIFMGGADGVEACKKIKSTERLKDIPIIVVTKGISMENMLTAFEAGAVDYISKPLDNKIELLPRMNSALTLKREMEMRKMREKEILNMAILLEESNRKLQQANEMLKSLATIDELTGVANRRYFNIHYQKEWKRALRARGPLTILMVDIDLFKSFNDIYGHQAGDECLRKIAEALKYVLKRPGDFIARYGGEEFVVLLTDTDQNGAVEVAKMMQHSVFKLAIPHSGTRVSDRITFSAGIGTFIPDQDSDPLYLINAADRALYRAKAEGRNRYAIFEEEKSSG